MSPFRLDVSHPIFQNPAATLGILLLTCSALLGASPTTEQTKFFESTVRPLLARNCYQCHSEQAKILYSNLRVDDRSALLNGGVRGPAIVPGDPDSSQLIQAVPLREARNASGRKALGGSGRSAGQMGRDGCTLARSGGCQRRQNLQWARDLNCQSEPLGLEAGAEGLPAPGPKTKSGLPIP